MNMARTLEGPHSKCFMVIIITEAPKLSRTQWSYLLGVAIANEVPILQFPP